MATPKSRKARSTKPPGSRSGAVIYWILAVIALAGLADATYLTVGHLTGENAVCGAALGCSTVLSSRYATVMGLPTASFGALAYFTVFSLSILAAFGYARVHGWLVGLVSLMLVASLYFLYLQAFVLHAFCPFCLFSAALTFLLAGLCLAFPAPRRMP